MSVKYLSLIMLLLVLSACGSAQEPAATGTPEDALEEPDSAPAPTAVIQQDSESGPSPLMPAQDDAYPGLPTQEAPGAYPEPLPTEDSQSPGGYPAPPPTLDPNPSTTDPGSGPEPYPGDTVWVRKAAGIQCEEPLLYPDIQSVREDLEAGGITILDVETVEMAVCAACDCPTSEHYRVLIPIDDLSKAEAEDWLRE